MNNDTQIETAGFLHDRAQHHGTRTALVTHEGTFTYRDLLEASARVAGCLGSGDPNLSGARVAFMAPPGFSYVAVQWGIWQAGGVAVPLAVSYPAPELAYVIADAEADIVVAHPDFADTLHPIAASRQVRYLTTAEVLGHSPTGASFLDDDSRAMIVYTSGTTGKPKGAVSTHRNIRSQITSLITAWGWSDGDHVLLALPLHHVHGIINVVGCALWAGARCTMLAEFDAGTVWQRFLEDDLTLFMGVPTIYQRLIAAYDASPPHRQRLMREACTRFRLMVSGSAALPVSVLHRWEAISHHVLLERYGMTEIGMALSQPLRGAREAGYVGGPLPGVEIRLVGEDGADVPPGVQGEILVRGPGVCREYWRRPDETATAFRDGWFCTGDVAVLDEHGYRILGRASVDIIKTGGFKVSALEIEEVLRTHPDIAECAVVGVTDSEWGERVCAALEMRVQRDMTRASLREWARERLAPYKIPRSVRVVTALPRNPMGKVVKPAVQDLFRDPTIQSEAP